MPTRSSAPRFRVSRLRPGLGVNRALERMKADALLRLEYVQGAPSWSLGGEPVSPETVSILFATNAIEPDNVSLFAGAPCQTWRFRR
jgi:hypothetical protein